MTASHTPSPARHWFSGLASALDPRSAPRLVLLLVGVVLACGRRTVTSWIRAARLSDEYRRCYTTVSAAGKRTDLIAARLAHEVVKPLVTGADRLDVGHARELMQRRVLFRPPAFEGSDGVILTLSDGGAVLEVRTPQAPPSRPAEAAKPPRASRCAGNPAPRRKPASGEAPGTRSDTGAADTGSRGGGARETKEVGLGPCPLCGVAVVEQDRSYGCSGWRGGCKFAIWKTVAGKKLGVRTAQALLRRGRSPRLKGFRSKAGKLFDARLKLENGAVRFEFDP